MDKTRLFTGAVLLLLALYALAGVFSAPFHADESMYLSQSRDYATFFVIGSPGSLRVDPPVAIDSPEYSRLVTGTVSTNAMGFLLWNTGYRDLENWQPAWYYPDDVATNIAAGRIPPDDVLWRGRLASALFLVGSIGIVAALGNKLVSPRAGILVALVFTLNPVILLNGRRAMQEGPLMFFTLMSLWLALRAVEHRRWFDWALLGAMMGLACASKASALMPLVGIGLFLAVQRPPVKGFIIAALSGSIIFLAITPAIWTNPPARLRLAAELRRDVLRGQTAVSPDAHESPIDHLTALITQPFPGKLQYFESPDFAEDENLRADISHYGSSPLRGILLPAWAGLGLVSLGLLHLIRLGKPSPILLCWAGVTLLLVGVLVPLGWQRYYLPWTIAAVFFAGLGLDFLAGTVQAFLPEKLWVWPRAAFPTRPSKP